METKKFKYKIDSYRCAKIDLREKQNSDYFVNNQSNESAILIISELISDLIKINAKAIWLYIPINLSHLITLFALKNFSFHHTEDNVLIMSKWLLNSKIRLPNYATHYFGVGGLIINQEGKILLVKEKNNFAKLKGIWKIPTGLAEKGETIQIAVLREIKEETGLNAKFEGVFNFREAYPYLFDSSDIFFTCICTVDTSNQSVDIITGGELVEYKWFSKEELEELVKLKTVSKNNQFFFSFIINLLPKKILSQTLKVGREITFLNSRFVFHNPKF